MSAYQTADIRNIAFVGHGSCGKTTLTESVLFAAKKTTRRGEVDKGTTVTDFEDEEKERKFSIDGATAFCTWKEKEFNIVDTPGYPDFLGHAASALRVVETAGIVISAAAGVEVNTRNVWNISEENGLARCFIVNNCDHENISYDEVLTQLREAFGQKCIPFTVPNELGAGFSSVASALTLGDGASERASAANKELMDAVVETDDALLEKYLEGQDVSSEEIFKACTNAISAGELYPIYWTCAEKEIGITELADGIADIFPSPKATKLKVKEGENEVALSDYAGGFVGQFFKVFTDPYVGKIAYFRCFAGELTADSSFVVQRTGKSEKAANVFRMQGKEQEKVTKIVTGDIVAVTKIEDVEINDTVAKEGLKCEVAPITFPEPMVALAVEPKSRGDEQRISGALKKLTDEDKTFISARDAQTNELVIKGMSTLHLEVVLSRMKRRYEVEVVTKDPKIAYLETITQAVDTHYRHKKQTGGKGQFGEVYLKIDPRDRGTGFEFIDKIVGGSVPNQFKPAVEKGIKQVMERGILSSSPVVDVAVTLYDGSYHSVDSSEAAFILASSKAFQEGFLKAKPVLLEPIMDIEVQVPGKFIGDITGDMNSRRGRIMGVDAEGAIQMVKAQVPAAEIARYSTELRSLTGGQGSYKVQFSHYDIVPSHAADKIMAENKKEKEEAKA